MNLKDEIELILNDQKNTTASLQIKLDKAHDQINRLETEKISLKKNILDSHGKLELKLSVQTLTEKLRNSKENEINISIEVVKLQSTISRLMREMEDNNSNNNNNNNNNNNSNNDSSNNNNNHNNNNHNNNNNNNNNHSNNNNNNNNNNNYNNNNSRNNNDNNNNNNNNNNDNNMHINGNSNFDGIAPHYQSTNAPRRQSLTTLPPEEQLMDDEDLRSLVSGKFNQTLIIYCVIFVSICFILFYCKLL